MSHVRNGNGAPAWGERRRRDRADEEPGERTKRRQRDGSVWSRIAGRRRNLGDSRRRKPRRSSSPGESSRLRREKTHRSRPHFGKNMAILGQGSKKGKRGGVKEGEHFTNEQSNRKESRNDI
ncbi:hypothetical protein NDU88_004444 [Pleurodeles waltl]|uniref:Uncharacterized protein n=1 Tax=Pleurodeles waltl TaxID=8319 RepID=A0AAV7KZX4_PLEWA|nr:hypothetical protein NDU88_004444 [Pleurodeles waltl]